MTDANRCPQCGSLLLPAMEWADSGANPDRELWQCTGPVCWYAEFREVRTG